jgi:hypothetical protein
MTNLTSTQLLAALSALIQSGVLAAEQPKAGGKFGKNSRKFAAFKGGSKAVKITRRTKSGETTDQPDKKLAYEASVVRGFMAKGLKQHQIELRSEGTNGVQTYKGWMKVGRQVMKGQRGVKGCFHYSQTEPMDVTKADLVKASAEYAAAMAAKPVGTDTDLHVA